MAAVRHDDADPLWLVGTADPLSRYPHRCAGAPGSTVQRIAHEILHDPPQHQFIRQDRRKLLLEAALDWSAVLSGRPKHLLDDGVHVARAPFCGWRQAVVVTGKCLQ